MANIQLSTTFQWGILFNIIFYLSICVVPIRNEWVDKKYVQNYIESYIPYTAKAREVVQLFDNIPISRCVS